MRSGHRRPHRNGGPTRAFFLQQLRRGRLYVQEIAGAIRECRSHFFHRARIDGFDLLPVRAVEMDGVSKHCQRLRTVIRQQGPAFEFLPIERCGSRLARHQEEPVALVDQREVQGKSDSPRSIFAQLVDGADCITSVLPSRIMPAAVSPGARTRR